MKQTAKLEVNLTDVPNFLDHKTSLNTSTDCLNKAFQPILQVRPVKQEINNPWRQRQWQRYTKPHHSVKTSAKTINIFDESRFLGKILWFS